MTLAGLSGSITAAALKADFDDKTSTLSTQAVLGQVDTAIHHRVESLTATDDVSVRSLDFTAPDDLEVRALRVLCKHTTTGKTVTATLTQTDGDTSFLLEQTVSQAVASVNGTAQATLDLRTTTGQRVMLLRGVRYRITLTVDAASVSVGQATIVVRSRRRLR